MKNLIQISIFTFLLHSIHILTNAQNTYVPDDNFEQALITLGYDTGPLDDYVPTANISAVTMLDVEDKNISDLTGIEDFTALEHLICGKNQLTALDLQQNSNLTELRCNENQITQLNLSGNPLLESLWFQKNQLSEVDLQNNAALIMMGCDDNMITSFDLTNNPKLERLFCSHNEISSFQFAENSKLYRFSCESNNLTEIDVSGLMDLDFLSVWNNELTHLDVSNNLLLTELLCGSNQLESIQIPENNIINKFDCRENKLSNLEEMLNVDGVNNTILEQNPTLVTFNIRWNNFDFADLEPRWSELLQLGSFEYHIQNEIGKEVELSIEQGTNFSLVIADFTPAENDQYQWYKDEELLDGETGSTLDFESIDYSDAGDYYCLVTNSVVTGLTLTSKYVTITITDPNGIETVDTESISIYPIPASDFIHIDSEDIGTIIQLYNLKGEKIMEYKMGPNGQIDVSELPKGIYALIIATPTENAVKKVMVQ